MNDTIKDIILNAIEDLEEINLILGENEFYLDIDSISVTISYDLERNDKTYDEDIYFDGYEFKIYNIYVTNNITNEETCYQSFPEIEQVLFNNANIEGLDDSDNEDNYFELTEY